MSIKDEGWQIALQEAKIGAAEGGLPVGACIMSKDGKVIGRGRNTRYLDQYDILYRYKLMRSRQQNGSPVLHASETSPHVPGSASANALQAETAAFDSERGLPISAFHGATLYTTLSPCWMCTGASIWFKVARVVIGESTTFAGPEDTLRSNGIEVVNLNSEECINISKKFIETYPDKWADTVR